MRSLQFGSLIAKGLVRGAQAHRTVSKDSGDSRGLTVSLKIEKDLRLF